MNKSSAFQDQIPNNHCFGCGPDNEQGLRIKSYWLAENESICRFQPGAHQSAGPEYTLNGGIISTLIDCHGVGTAIAWAYELEGREIGQGEPIWYVTGGLKVTFKKPVPIDREVVIMARVGEVIGRKMKVYCSLQSNGQECAAGEVIAVRVPLDWSE